MQADSLGPQPVAPSPGQTRFISIALVCVLVGFALQFANAAFRYSGNWTGLFCTGSLHPLPAQLAHENIFVFTNSPGYDGQMYHYVAHDPLATTNIKLSMDDSQLRYRRILLPAVAYALALGQQRWIDAGYIAANLAFLFLGAWWLSRYLHLAGLDYRWAALFVLAPACLIGLDRLVVDLAFTSLCVGAAFYWRTKQVAKTYCVLILACLTRETGFLLVSGFAVANVVERRFAKAALFVTAVLPTTAWYIYLMPRTPERTGDLVQHLVPFRGMAAALLHPMEYPFGVAGALLAGLDRIALLGILLAAVLTLKLIVKNGAGALELAMVFWSITAICMPRDALVDSSSAGRVFTPLLMYAFMAGVPVVGWRMAIPLAAAVPRTCVEVGVPLLTAILRT